MEEELLTVEEVGKYLKMNPQIIRRKLASGEIKGLKFERIWRVKKKDLDEYLNSKYLENK